VRDVDHFILDPLPSERGDRDPKFQVKIGGENDISFRSFGVAPSEVDYLSWRKSRFLFAFFY